MVKEEKYSVKKEIEKALLNIMTEKSVMDITVTELVKEAKVARVSFYRNFSSITDVVDSIAEQTAHLFSSEIIPPIHSKDERKWREFLFYYFHQISRNPREFLVSDISNCSALNNHINIKVGAILENQPEPTNKETYSWIGKLSLLHSISKSWVANGMPESLEEMIDYIMSIINHF